MLRCLALASLLVTSIAAADYPTLGKITRLDPALDEVLAPFARLEVLASGFEWSEGPVWVPAGGLEQDAADGGFVLFCDIPNNTIHRWSEKDGLSVFMKPSGYTGFAKYSNEPGSNGLILDSEGRLTLCEHGDRRVSHVSKGGGKMTLADSHEGKRLNSPNDLCFAADGTLYFTDPPYGLPGQADSELREMDFCGVYKIDPNGELSLLTKEMTRPNGIGLSPDGKTLYVAQSDRSAAVIKAFPVKGDGTLGESRIFFDATSQMGTMKGSPDGLDIDTEGRLWATGPGGVWVLSPEGRPLGRIETGEATANCTFGGDDGSTLYITADMYLCRIQTKAKGHRVFAEE